MILPFAPRFPFHNRYSFHPTLLLAANGAARVQSAGGRAAVKSSWYGGTWQIVAGAGTAADRAGQQLVRSLVQSADRIGLPIAPIEVKGAAHLVPDLYRSDHAPFWRRGFPAVMLTDTANFRNRHYHVASDTISFDLAAQVMTSAVDTLLSLAGGCPSNGTRLCWCDA